MLHALAIIMNHGLFATAYIFLAGSFTAFFLPTIYGITPDYKRPGK